MDDATFTSDTASMDRRSLPEQLAIISSLFHKESSADDAAATAAARNRNVVEGRAREGVRLINDQMAAVSTELLLTVMLDMMLLRLLDGLGLEEGRAVSFDASSSDEQQLMDAAAKKKIRAAAKKKRNKRNKAAVKHKKTSLVSWLGGGILPLIMMAAFGSITTLIAFSLIHSSDGSSEGEDPPTLPPSASTSLGQRDIQSNIVAPISPSSLSPLPLVVQAPAAPPMNLVERETVVEGFGFGSNPLADCCDNKDKDPMFVFIGSTLLQCQPFRLRSCDAYPSEALEHHPSSLESYCCPCETDPIKVNNNSHHDDVLESYTVGGLYNECKCDFWSTKCEGEGKDSCDYAAEYCCGDYNYTVYKNYVSGGRGDRGPFSFVNSKCYCDFANYAQNAWGHTLKPHTLNEKLNMAKVFSNPCFSDTSFSTDDEKRGLIAIYNATNGQNWTNNDGWDETVDHCEWHGITCDDEEHVTGIDLRDNNLVGHFPVYTRNGNVNAKYDLANLLKLKTLDMANNKLTGTIEHAPLYNLLALTRFDVSGNQLSGELDVLIAPSLTYANFSNNVFTSVRRFLQYKVPPLQSLRYCDVSNNFIQQNATNILEIIPPNIEQFIASNNNISGSLPASLNYLSKLRQFNMASNALSGDVPGFTESFATLEELDLSNQMEGFTGPIPKDVWRSLSLKILNLAGNRLTGILPSLVGNLAVLEVFDLSNNLLKGSLPSELGLLGGGASLKRLGLSNNDFTGKIPYQIGQLQGASVLLKDNRFQNTSTTAPLNLCLERKVNEFDLADDTVLCPPERNDLSDFYDSAKGADWTSATNWMHEYVRYCEWEGVTCDDSNSHVTELNLNGNGLSGRLNESIGNLIFINKLDLSDNDIKGTIPTKLGELSNLIYLRLSYNAFTGTAPEGLSTMKGLKLLQLQSNRITEIPAIARLNSDEYGPSTFVTDCGTPSAFKKVLVCKNCTMCCNANDDCYPQKKTRVDKWGLKDYGISAIAFFVGFVVICCLSFCSFYACDKSCPCDKRKHSTSKTSEETKRAEDDTTRDDEAKDSSQKMKTREQKQKDHEDALEQIGDKSVYSYFVTDKVFGWFIALATLITQITLLALFIMASEAKLQDDKTELQFTWLCPRDTEKCKDTSELTYFGWACFSLLMFANLGTDLIGGARLIHLSAKVRHSRVTMFRYFFGGMGLCSITLLALYVSTVYNKAIATSNTEIILNAVIVLFVTEFDEWNFSLLGAINKDWTNNEAAPEDASSDTNAGMGGETKEKEIKKEGGKEDERKKDEVGTTDKTKKEKDDIIDEMKAEIASQKEQISSQQDVITAQGEKLEKLSEIVQKMQESQAAAAEQQL